MRITHQMLSRNYLKRMNTNLSSLTRSNEKMASGRAYDKSWEDVNSAGKALRVRRLIADNERYQSAIQDIEGRVEAAEEGLRAVNSLLIQAEDRVVAGLNDTMAPEDREKLATELGQLQGEILQVMNSQFSNSYLYNAAGNADGSPPFSTSSGGDLLYNGYRVDDLQTSSSGEIMFFDTATNTYEPILWNEENFVNIGYGYQIDANGEVDPNTAFQSTVSGVEAFGFGRSADGTPVNVYSLFGSMVDNLNTNNMDGLNQDLAGIPVAMEALLTSITEIGARGATLDDTMSRLESEYINLVETQGELESIDLSEEIIHNKSYEMSWMVTLQLGSKILPQTIFDFIS